MVRQQGASVGSAYIHSPCGGMRCYSPSGPGARYILNDLCTGRTYTVLLMREIADLLQFLIHQYHCVDWTCNGPRVQVRSGKGYGPAIGKETGSSWTISGIKIFARSCRMWR
ncbi:unnamed protein product, partial [Pylaiella littoralis]